MGHTEAGDREGRVVPVSGTRVARVPGDAVSPSCYDGTPGKELSKKGFVLAHGL